MSLGGLPTARVAKDGLTAIDIFRTSWPGTGRICAPIPIGLDVVFSEAPEVNKAESGTRPTG
jgi:hypothetical protein